ncbi:hypothetical protein AA973_07330 [Helicobacter pylori]|uniref:Uncharacterized protein n=1 Tax=Helicobacter pylori TaxID=210 RepID=A0A1A9HC65_HELPX|nr:hypothetical protein AA973_07330 [Helicobacter pylori]
MLSLCSCSSLTWLSADTFIISFSLSTLPIRVFSSMPLKKAISIAVLISAFLASNSFSNSLTLFLF